MHSSSIGCPEIFPLFASVLYWLSHASDMHLEPESEKRAKNVDLHIAKNVLIQPTLFRYFETNSSSTTSDLFIAVWPHNMQNKGSSGDDPVRLTEPSNLITIQQHRVLTRTSWRVYKGKLKPWNVSNEERQSQPTSVLNGTVSKCLINFPLLRVKITP